MCTTTHRNADGSGQPNLHVSLSMESSVALEPRPRDSVRHPDSPIYASLGHSPRVQMAKEEQVRQRVGGCVAILDRAPSILPPWFLQRTCSPISALRRQ